MCALSRSVGVIINESRRLGEFATNVTAPAALVRHGAL